MSTAGMASHPTALGRSLPLESLAVRRLGAAVGPGATAQVIRVCAWCEAVLGGSGAGTGEPARVSHGICSDCSAEQLHEA